MYIQAEDGSESVSSSLQANSTRKQSAKLIVTSEMQLAIDAARRGENFAVIGPAGTGKSELLKLLSQGSCVVGAPTGIAANNVGGRTIHGLCAEAKQKSLLERDTLANARRFIIDEVSMASPRLLNMLGKALKEARESYRPFGDAQVILFGDPAQLPPIWSFQERVKLLPDCSNGWFDSAALRRMHYIELTRVFRQSDTQFAAALAEARVGNLSPSSLDLLNSRVTMGIPMDATVVSDRRETANAINDYMMDVRLPGTARVYTPLQDVLIGIDRELVSRFTRRMITPTLLKLKVGARVIFTKNDFDNDVYNGLGATVLALEDATIHVVDDNGIKHAVTRRAFDYDHRGEAFIDRKNQTAAGSLRLFPLLPAYALTVHKSQGLTLDRLHYQVDGPFSHGQAYVALSRTRTLAGLSLSRPLTRADFIHDANAFGFRDKWNVLRSPTLH